MTQSLLKNWLLPVLCCVLYGIVSAFCFSHAEYGFHSFRSGVLLGRLIIACGICVMVTGIWSKIDYSRLLLTLNGLACAVLGLLITFRRSLTFSTVSLFIAIMAAGFCMRTWIAVRDSKHSLAEGLFLKATELVSIFWILAFSAFLFRWLRLDPQAPGESLLWLGFFFGFCAIYMATLLPHGRFHLGTGTPLPQSIG